MSFKERFRKQGIPERYLDDYFLYPVIILCDDVIWVNPNVEKYHDEICAEGEYIAHLHRLTFFNKSTKKLFWARVKSSLLDGIVQDNSLREEMKEKMIDFTFSEFIYMITNPNYEIEEGLPISDLEIFDSLSEVLENLGDWEFNWEYDPNVHMNTFRKPITYH